MPRRAGACCEGPDDASGVSSKRVPRLLIPERVRLVASVLACMAVVLWVRLLPLSLPVADDWARMLAGRPGYPTDQAALARTLRADLSFQGADGRQHVYLGDFDSYHWLRMARNYLERGTACDAVVDGRCRDTLATAPLGSRMIYARSVHVLAIVVLHRVLTFFVPGLPLSTSAYLVPVVVGVLGVVPAFLLGRALGGLAGGAVAALLISLNAVYLERSLGSDNDVWNVVLPVCVLWLVVAALAARGRWRPVLLSALAGGATALHATTWRGWLFAYGVVLCGLVAQMTLLAIRHVVRTRTLRAWRAPGLGALGLVAVVFQVTSGALMWLGGHERAYLSAFSMLTGDEVAVDEAGYWPYVLQTVAEFAKPKLAEIVRATGGVAVFLVGLLGVLLRYAPETSLRLRHAVTLAIGLAVPLYLVATGGLGRNQTVLLFAGAFAAVVLARVFDADAPPPAEQATSMLLLGWFLAGLLFSYEGTRFVTFLIVPGAAAIGVVAQRLGGPPWARLAIVTGLVALLVLPVRAGYAAARRYVPGVDDAWWTTLERLRRETPPDAIVNTWWDYGYWVQYVAERRVSVTGGSLLNHVPHWMARALVARSERETLGILRMLNCGSDAMPFPDGRHGAYGKVLASGRDPLAAYTTVLDLVMRDRAEAQAYLAARGFSPGEQATILASTHCTPPDSYLVLSSDLATKAGAWLYLGTWDMRRAHVARETRTRPEAEVLAEIAEAFDYSTDETAALYARARTIRTRSDLDAFAAPRGRGLPPRWYPCRDVEGRLICTLGVTKAREGVGTLAFVYDPAAPRTGRLRVRGAGDERDETPAAIVVAAARLDETTFASPTHPDVGILVDVANRRVLAGRPELLRSTFIGLMYLDGRYASHFEKFEDASTRLGNRVVTWKVRWP